MHHKTRPQRRHVIGLRKLRRDREIAVTALALKIGVPRSYISDYESGRREPSLAIARQLAREFGVSIEALFEKVAVPA